MQETKTSEKQSRRARLTRATPKELPRFRITPRDVEILTAVYEYRVLTAPQIDQLFFTPATQDTPATPSSRCQRRLMLLYHHGFLERREQLVTLTEGAKPLMYVLDTKGVALLADMWDVDEHELDWHPRDKTVSPQFLAHHLAINTVRIAVTLAARAHGFTIEKWFDERLLRREHMVDTVTITGERGRKEKAAVVPDSYFLLSTGTHRYHLFLEVDMATVTGDSPVVGRRDWRRKIAAYLAYYNSGKYAERYQSTGLRVLTVTTSEQRLLNLKQITERVGGKARFWFTTLAQATPAAILTVPICQVAGREGLHSLTW